jgi:hypothetical protein
VIRGTGSLKNKVQHLFYRANAFARLRQIISNRYFSLAEGVPNIGTTASARNIRACTKKYFKIDRYSWGDFILLEGWMHASERFSILLFASQIQLFFLINEHPLE